MHYLDPVVTRETAIAVCLRKPFPFSLASRTETSVYDCGAGRLPAIELIWFPHYLIPIRLTTPKVESWQTVSVEGGSGAFAIFDVEDEVKNGVPNARLYPPKLSEADAVKEGRNRLLRTIMHQRSRGAKPKLGETGAVRLLQYPYWVFYYERRRKFVDVKVVDAIMGRRAGAKTRAAVLDAFVEHDKPQPGEHA